MRLPVFLALAIAATIAAASAGEPPNARAAFVERRGLIEADAHCRLFSPDIRAALEAGAGQARGALLRAGWSTAQVRDLEIAVVSAARERACDDERTSSAAEEARNAFANWVNASSLEFPGWERAWTARRVAARDGWRLSQAVTDPFPATFGVRERNGRQQLVLVAPFTRGDGAPREAQLLMRDASRSEVGDVSLPQRVAFGLAAGAPSPDVTTTMPSVYAIEPAPSGGSQAVFTFPDLAFRGMLLLDPRESVEIRVTTGGRDQRLYVEVGDVAAARAFLAVR